MLSIEPDFQAQILSLLKWLAFSNRTLDLEELAEIFILRPERAVGFDIAERLFEPDEVLRYVSSLVTVHKETTMWGESKTYARLAHFIVKEYLISSRICKGPAAFFSFTENDAHLHISHCCLVYHVYETDNVWVEEGFPLGNYATSLWGWHLEMAPRHKWTSEIVHLVARALAIRSRSLRKILQCGMEGLARLPADDEEAREDQLLRRPYCYTVRLGFPNLTELLLSTDDYLTQKDLDLTLRQAIVVGSIELVQLLLDKGGRVDGQYYKGGSALQVAASENHLEVVKLLLSRGADTYKSMCPLTSALLSLRLTIESPPHSQTTLESYMRCLQLLIDNGADINKQCDVHGTALSTAVSRMLSHDTKCFVDFLLQRGANVNLSDGFFGNPLHAACSHLNFDIDWDHYNATAMTLLKMGAEVNGQGGEYGNALQAASYAGDFAIVRRLLDGGAEKNIPGGRCGTALQAACESGHRNIVDILVASGADVDIPGGIYGSALQAACAIEHRGIVDILLASSAEVDVPGGAYGSALQAACATGNREIVGLLIGRGARVDIQGGMFGNALQAACHAEEREPHSKMDIVQKLLEMGADVNAAGGEFGSALQAASSCPCDSDEAVASFLISKGAEVNNQGGLYGTAIQAACSRGRIGLVRLLLAHDSNLNIVGGKYGTALQAACAYEDSQENTTELVGLLIEHGADVHIRGGVFGSAWHAGAAQVGNSNGNKTLEILLDHGVDLNESGGSQYETALQAAFELPGTLH